MQPITITYDIETGRFFADGSHTRRVKDTTNDKILYDIMNFLLDEGIISSTFSFSFSEASYKIGFPADFKLRDGDFVIIDYEDSYKIGVICNNTVIYQDSGYDRIKDIAIYSDFLRVAAVFRCDDGSSFGYAKERFFGSGSIGKVYYRNDNIRNILLEKGESLLSKENS